MTTDPHHPYLRIVDFFDKDETAGSFLNEDGDGGFTGAVYRMAREIDRLRAIASLPSDDEVGRVVSEWQKAMEGVTPGPWVLIPAREYDGEDDSLLGSYTSPAGIEGSDGNPVCVFGIAEGSGTLFENEANHLFLRRCSPDSISSLLALLQSQAAELAAVNEALTPSGATKAEYIGEFFEQVEIRNPDFDDDDDAPETIMQRVPVSWTTIKAIMAAIARRAHSKDGGEHA